MNGNSRQEKIENLQKEKAARKKKFLIVKIIITCVIILAAIITGVAVKHAVNGKSENPEASAIVTASPENNSNAGINLQPITAPVTTTKPETTTKPVTTAVPETTSADLAVIPGETENGQTESATTDPYWYLSGLGLNNP